MGNSQKYIKEHQMLTWINSPFTIIIALETLFLSFVSKVKLRDFFMICGLVLMSVISTRHLSLLALIGTICFARLFSMYLEFFQFNVDNKVINFLSKKFVFISSFVIVIIASSLLLANQWTYDYIDNEMYPIEATKFIKENINIEEMRIFNEYNFGSYLLLNDIPVFIDSRADLYTKQFSGFEHDMFDDYSYMPTFYQEKFDFYDITHVLVYKKKNAMYNALKKNANYKILYEDEFFVLYERLGTDEFSFTIN